MGLTVRTIESVIANGGKLIGTSKNSGVQVFKTMLKDGGYKLDSFTKNGEVFKTIEKKVNKESGVTYTEWMNNLTGFSGNIRRYKNNWNMQRNRNNHVVENINIRLEEQDWITKIYNKLLNKKPIPHINYTERRFTVKDGETTGAVMNSITRNNQGKFTERTCRGLAQDPNDLALSPDRTVDGIKTMLEKLTTNFKKTNA